MHRTFALFLLVCVSIVVLSSAAVGAPSSITHQGRLLDSEGAPLSGTRSMTFSLYDDSTGGSLLWSETQPSVSVTDGLFSVILGSITPLTTDLFASPPSSGVPQPDLFMQITVESEEILPRRRLTSSAYSMVTQRLSGDVHTSPDQLAIGDLDGDGIPDVVLVSDVSGARLAINTKGTGAKRTGVTASSVAGESSEIRCDADFNEDGFPDIVVSSFVSADSSGFVTEGYDDPAGMGIRGKAKGIIISKPAGGGTVHGKVLSSLAYDADDDGNPETSAQTEVTNDALIDALDMDSDDDGVSEVRVRGNVVSGSFTGGPGVVILRMVDTNGDGAPELTAGEAVMADSARRWLDNDSDGDGIPTATERTLVTADSAGHWLDMDSDDDGVPETEVRHKVLPTMCAVAIKTKGTGADKNRSSGSTTEADDTTASNLNWIDLESDGLPDVAVVEACTIDSAFKESSYYFPNAAAPTYILKAKEKANKTKCGNDLRSLGLPLSRTASSEISCDTASAVTIEFATSGAGPSDGTGLYNQRCTLDSVSREVTYAFPDTITPLSLSKVKEKANKSVCRNNLAHLRSTSQTESETSCDSATAASTWRADNFSGSIISVAIQASTDPLINPIEHSSGAHLTPGGVWTNASDENLKENFQPVDGNDLLEKIESLNISEWNYKTESDDTRHIGPTAQDFQKTFGVGSDGTTISTIDPSGIALAAIKALNEKSKRIDELEKQVKELNSLVQQLLKKDN